MAREAPTEKNRRKRRVAAFSAAVLALLLTPFVVLAGHRLHYRLWHRPHAHHLPYPNLPLPFHIDGSQYVPLAWADIPGWNDDDQLAAFRTFRTSCRPIAAEHGPPAEAKAIGISLRIPCRAARAAKITDNEAAKAFFEANFVPVKISRLGQDDGFVTGYYEPVLEGSRTQTDVYNVPVYRRPSNLFVRGYKQDAPDLPNKGPVYRKIGRRKLVPYYDRGEIEDGAIAGRGLEICWLKDQTDLLFAQIQGSARIHLPDGSTIRINYDAHNGYPYTPVGRILIDRGIIPKDQMSMQKIRDWMEANPDAAKEVRRQNRSYVFFREVPLSDTDEPIGAQGVPLTPGRSIAVDQSLHVYGTPFFIFGELPIESAQSKTPFHRLMIAQDTGSAITGPARADLYFGAGADAGRISGRLKNNMQFVMLVPKSLDPVERGRRLPVPEPRPSEEIAKLFPQIDALADPGKDKPMDPPKDLAKDLPKSTNAAKAVAPAPSGTVARASSAGATVNSTPLPHPRPAAAPTRDLHRH